MRRTAAAAVGSALAVGLTACAGGGHHATVRRSAVVTTPAIAPASAPPTSAPAPVSLDADVAALPDGHGARIAIVIDDVGYTDTYLSGYLGLDVPLSFAVIPAAPHAADDDEAIHRAGRDLLVHIPLATGPGSTAPDGGLAVGTSPSAIDRWVAAALRRVPHAVGANNHLGAYGPTQPSLMRPLLAALQARGLFFLDSVTSGRTVGFAIARQLGMPSRINNVFCDHYETDQDSRQAVLQLARDAAAAGGAIGIGHVFHPYVWHVLASLAPQLRARGYVFAPVSEVTDAPGPGLDAGVRTTL